MNARIGKLYLLDAKGAWKLFDSPTAEDLSSRGITIATTATVGDNARLGRGTIVGADATVGDGARIGDWASVGAGATVRDGARLGDWARIGAWASIGDGATVCDGARVGAHAIVCAGATVATTGDCLMIGPLGSRNAMLTATRHGGEIRIATGCFAGSLAEFRAAVAATHGDSEHVRVYARACTMIEAWGEEGGRDDAM